MTLSLGTLKVVLQALLLRAARMTFTVPPTYGQNPAAWRPTTFSEMPVVRAGRTHIQIVLGLPSVVQYGFQRSTTERTRPSSSFPMNRSPTQDLASMQPISGRQLIS